MISPSYSIAAVAYLDRARRRLDEGSLEGLFYAAFELRCGIEQRLREYLEVRHDISEKRKQGWQIAKLGAEVDRAFQIRDQIAEITIVHSDGTPPMTLQYVPVRPRLRKMAERLGDLLHAARDFRAPDDPWWESTREWLTAVSDELQAATSGTLLGPPLLNKQTGQMLIHAVLDETDRQHALSTFGRVGERAMIHVEYFEFSRA